MSRITLIALAALFTVPGAEVMAQTQTDAGERVSVSTQMPGAERDRGSAGVVTEDRFAALETREAGTAKTRSTVQSKTLSKSLSAGTAINTDFWFYDADVVLFNDHDGDGHYYGIDLWFDADTIYNYAEVYAVAYLSLDGGPWNEYAATDVFALTGAVGDDEYVIVTELVSGYPTGSYDLLIELFDADTDAFVASYGPENTPALAFLALEDTARDTPQQTTTVIVRERGGGSAGWFLLLGLTLAAVPALRRRWPG